MTRISLGVAAHPFRTFLALIGLAAMFCGGSTAAIMWILDDDE